jgi:hypothetical protein
MEDEAGEDGAGEDNTGEGETGSDREIRRAWTIKRREMFLDRLAETLNVRASCRAAQIATSRVYEYRRANAEFAERWRAAVVAGYDRLEAALMVHAGIGVDDDGNSLPFDAELALRLLGRHTARMQGKEVRHRGGYIKQATAEETNAVILKKLALLDRRAQTAAARGAPPALPAPAKAAS